MQQTLIILIVSTALIVSVLLFLFLLTSTISNSLEVTATIFQGQEGNSKTKDNMKDTKLIALHKTNVVPKVRDYHDILSIDIKSMIIKWYLL